MDSIEIIGFIAGFLTTFAFVPQVFKLWKYRTVHDISLPMYIILTLGTGLWLTYGFLIGSISLMLANFITFSLSLCVICMILAWRNN